MTAEAWRVPVARIVCATCQTVAGTVHDLPDLGLVVFVNWTVDGRQLHSEAPITDLDDMHTMVLNPGRLDTAQVRQAVRSARVPLTPRCPTHGPLGLDDPGHVAGLVRSGERRIPAYPTVGLPTYGDASQDT